jgi:hypothetical protein
LFHPTDGLRDLRQAVPIAQDFIRHGIQVAAELVNYLVAALLLFVVTLPHVLGQALRSLIVHRHLHRAILFAASVLSFNMYIASARLLTNP